MRITVILCPRRRMFQGLLIMVPDPHVSAGNLLHWLNFQCTGLLRLSDLEEFIHLCSGCLRARNYMNLKHCQCLSFLIHKLR